ncbi:MAG: hypothetical protein ACRENA_10330 [Vulcanimicrobiaceae bacterium]
MKLKMLTTGVLCATLAIGTVSPALADGGAATRNFVLLGAAAAIGITNWNHKRHIKQEEMHEQGRRQEAYREWYYKKYGTYPTDAQFHDWYVKTYGVPPSN